MANVIANRSVNMSELNLHRLISGFYDSNFYNNVPVTVGNYTYQDTFEVIYYASGYYGALFGGRDFSFNASGGISGGSVTGFIQSYYSGSTPMMWWGIEAINVNATQLYNAALTPSTLDEFAIIRNLLSGNDNFYLSSGDDWAYGYSGSDNFVASGGNDVLAGGAGNDVIDGGSGNDTAVFSRARGNYKIRGGSTTGSVLVISTDEGTDTLTNIEYLQFSDQTVVLADINLNSRPTGTLSLNGKFSQGNLLTLASSIADEDGIPASGTGAISYVWYANGEEIQNMNTSRLLLTQDHVGKSITVTAFYTDLLGTSETVTTASYAPVLNVNDAPTGSVVVSGTATQNEVLIASHTLADQDGLGTITYQWKAGGKDIGGATSETLMLTQALVGQAISVTASYIDGFGKKEAVSSSVTSKVTNVNDVPTGQPGIAGTASEDQTLRAVTSAITDADGLGAFKYQWQSSVDSTNWISISAATAPTYKLSDADVGKYIRTTISYTDKFGTTEAVNGDPTARVANLNDKPAGLPAITGKFIEGETLRANTSKLADGDGLGSFSYLWQTSTDKKTWVNAGTSTSLQLAGTSAKQFVQLVVSYVDGNGTAESVTSASSTAIATKALTLLGTASDDILAGMSGNDILIGGLGSDQLTGGAGNDLFSFKSINESLPSSFDYILDFSAGDKIDLKGIDANTALAGDQAFSFQSAATRNAVWWNTETLNGDVNGDAIADFAVHVSLVGLTEFRSANVIL